MKKILFCFLFSLFGLYSVSFGASLFNFQDDSIQKEISRLNDDYRFNLNVVILEKDGDKCFEQDINNYVQCVEDNYPVSSLTFIIHWGIGQMHSIGQPDIDWFMDGGIVKDFEVEVKSGLRANGTAWGINTYIGLLEKYIKNECVTYSSASCVLADIKVAKEKYKIEQAEKQRELDAIAAEEQRKFNAIAAEGKRQKDLIAAQERAEFTKKMKELTKDILIYGLIASIISGISYFFYITIRNNSSKKRLVKIFDDLLVLEKEIEFDTNIFKEDKEKYLKNIKKEKEKLEELLSQKNDYIYKKTNGTKVDSGLTGIKDEYKKSLEIISKSHIIEEQVESIKNINL